MPNQPGGAIQVLDNSTEAINQALAQILERVDDLKGLRGPVTIHDRMSVEAPIDPLDAVNLESLINEFAANVNAPYTWPALGNTQRPSEMQGEDSQLDPADPLLWSLTDRFMVPEEGMSPHEPWLWLFDTTGMGIGSGQEPQNAPPVVATASAIGTVLDRYAAEDHTHGITTDTFTVTGTGFVDPDPTGTARYALLGPVVVLFLPILTGTSDATTFTLTGLPAAITPTRTGWHTTRGTNNSVNILVYMRFNASSTTVDLFTAPSAAVWAAANTKAIFETWVTYALL